MTSRLWELVLAHDGLADLEPSARRLELRNLAIAAGAQDPATEVGRIADALDGTGPLTELLGDPDVTDVLVNGPYEVWIERSGELVKTDVRFDSRHELEMLIERSLGRAGARADASSPIADARLPDGSRFHVVMSDVAPGGPLLSIRRHPRAPLGLAELAEHGSLDPDQSEILSELVARGASMILAGATGAGKTTLMRALLAEVPSSERIVTVEETAELSPGHPHCVSLVARPPNVEGRGEVSVADLARAALRMRPTRLVIGEVRGSEAEVALQAMSTGHRGSMLTIHASSPEGALERFALLASGSGWSERAIRRCLAASVDAVVQLVRQGDRRVVSTIAMQ